MVKTYNALEGTLDIKGAASASRTGTTNAVAIVGGYDANNAAGSVNAGSATKITDPANAEDTFGSSELARLAQAVAANGVGEIWGVPVAETSVTGEDPAAGTSGQLANSPVFDPTLHPEHDITDQNGNTINVSYDVSAETVSGTEGYVNPVNGNFKGDGGTTYSLDYTYSDAYDTAITEAAKQDVRSLLVGTENDSVTSTIQTELANRADDFDFDRAFVGADPDIAPGDISSYTPNTQDWRIVEVAPARASGPDGDVRTAAAVCGFMSSQPIGPDGSGLFEKVNGLDSLNRSYRASEAKDFTGVTPLTRTGTIAQAKTTSTTTQFKNIYATEIIDLVAENLFATVREYAGGPQDVGELETLLATTCQSFARGNPPDLGFARDTNDTPYDVQVSLDPNDSSVADASVTIVPYPIAETVDLSLTVSDGFVQFQGAT